MEKFNLIFYVSLTLSVFIMFINVFNRIKYKKNNELIEYMQLILLLITFLFSILANNKFNIVIFLILSLIILATRQIIKLKN